MPCIPTSAGCAALLSPEHECPPTHARTHPCTHSRASVLGPGGIFRPCRPVARARPTRLASAPAPWTLTPVGRPALGAPPQDGKKSEQDLLLEEHFEELAASDDDGAAAPGRAGEEGRRRKGGAHP